MEVSCSHWRFPNFECIVLIDSIRGLSPEDLLYPFDRQYWYDNYKDLLESRPIDPHSVTYQETMYVSLLLAIFHMRLYA